MPSIEQSIKNHFSRVFQSSDWGLFKEVSDINLAEAAMLKKKSFKSVPQSQRLLIRNTRKRLLIGIGTELLLKAVYLKSGYSINKPLPAVRGIKPPFKLDEVEQAQLDPNETYTFAQLTDHLKHVFNRPLPTHVLDGLKIAKVFRNKEGHMVTRSHTFDPSSYRRIEAALTEIYEYAFSETLTVRFSFERGENGAWKITY